MGAECVHQQEVVVPGKLQEPQASVVGHVVAVWTTCVFPVGVSVLSNLRIPVSLYNNDVLLWFDLGLLVIDCKNLPPHCPHT